MYEHTISKPKGYIVITGEKGIKEFDTHQCCHCGNHFARVKGSGRLRGFCLNCMQITCGRKECDICIPFEERLKRMEHGI